MQDFTRRTLLQGGTALAAAGALTGTGTARLRQGLGASGAVEGGEGRQAHGDALETLRSGGGRRLQRHGRGFQDRHRHRDERLQRILRGRAAEGFGRRQHRAGLDVVWGLHTLPQLFPTKVLQMNDVADYLGKKYGGWTDAAAITCKQGNDWLGIPVATIGGYMTYRKSAVDKAGFNEFPKDFPGFLEMCKALKKNNTPAGFALGHASGDANGWLHWMLWGHGAYTVDKNDKVIINSPETVKALEYCKALSDTFIPGTASWNDGSNNKAYLVGRALLHRQRHLDLCRGEGRSDQEGAHRGHLSRAVCRSVRSASRPNCSSAVPILAFNFTKYPNAAKAFIAFMLEKENYDKWLTGARGYLTHTLNAYDSSPVWTADPKNQVFSQASKRALPASGIGTPGEKAATAIADFLVVDMFANYCTGREDCPGRDRDCRTAVEAHLSLMTTETGGKQLPPVSAERFAIEDETATRPLTIAGFCQWLTSHSNPRTPGGRSARPPGGISSRPIAIGLASGSCCRQWRS